MESAPQSLVCNRFTVLEVEDSSDNSSEPITLDAPQFPPQRSSFVSPSGKDEFPDD